MSRGGDGLLVATHRWDGAGAPVLAVHATGFCKETWGPVVADLRQIGHDCPVVAIDQRGHGDSAAPEPPFDWWDLGADSLAVARTLGAGVIGVGHSSGAAALAMAELLGPGTFRSLLLVEPIIFPGPFGRMEDNPMATAALRRRRSFPSPGAAADNFRDKPPFAAWDERALQAYVTGGLVARDEGWELKCSPEVEAEYYRSAGDHGAWDRLGEIGVPVVLVAGASSDTHPGPFLEATRQRFARATAVVVDDASHFVPMEKPAVVAELLGDMLQGGIPAGRR